MAYPNRLVLDSVTVGVEEGDRIGIVGRNGDGKSTLLRILAGTLEPDDGRVTRRSGVTVGMLGQDDGFADHATVGWAIVRDTPEHEWASDPRIRSVINGLVPDIAWDAQIGTLSGGQRRRVALASVLAGDHDIVILDEPTNHLDVEGVAWLAEHLKQRWPRGQGALLVVTHDRWFLDEVCLDTWEVHDGIVEPFEGGYAAYVLQRIERDRIAAATEQKRQNLMRKELAWLRRGAPARTSKPKFRIDAANQIIEDVPPVRNSLELKRMATARLGKDVVDLIDASVSYGDHEVLRDVTWRIGPGERSGVLGANGAGKSTLLGLITGTLKPSPGRVKHGKTVRIGVLDQQFSDLDEIGDDLVREVLARFRTTFVVDGKELTPAQLLQRLGFDREHLSTRVSELSGGLRRRLQLLLVLMKEPNVLVLDEPTNDVDTDMLTATEDLLDSWPGTLIVVSHDRYLLERVTDQQYAILDGRLRHVPGGVDEYLSLVERSAKRGVETMVSENASRHAGFSSASGSTQPVTLTGAELRALQKELSSLERKMEKSETAVGKIHAQMAQHDQSDYAGLAALTGQLRTLEAEQESLEERWLEVSAQLD
ncbi:ATPase components of ABC transporters with duplicated ATPase domains [Ruaniaceae bacterium KH17]|nr:ATPase components of ABC transporters with duplicated ATPase domains [Ruaniaceae bacterium KH17]